MANIISKDKKELIIASFKEGVLIKDIAKLFGTHPTTVSKVIKSVGLIPRRRKYHLNEAYFQKIDNCEKAYWLGFIYADGSVAGKTGLRIDLQARDKTHLLKLVKALNVSSNYNLKTRLIKNKEYSQFNICSTQIKNDLISYGITEDKTVYPIVPKISDEFIIPFLRGYFDGDGCLSYSEHKTKNRIRLVTCYFLVHVNIKDWLYTKLKLICPNIEFSCQDHPRTPFLKKLCISGYTTTIKVLDTIYKDYDVSLDRKYQKYLYIKERIMMDSPHYLRHFPVVAPPQDQ